MRRAEWPAAPMLRCRLCGSYGRHEFYEDTDSALEPVTCLRCPECDEYALHDVLTGVDGYVEYYELECEECGYETLWFRELTGTPETEINCPECPRDPSVDLRTLAGVGDEKATALIEAGYKSVDDIRIAKQDDLAEVDGIGNALAARIKADVTSGSGHDWHLPKLSIKRERWVIEPTADE